MKAFTPDSSIASDVIPSPNHGERNKGRVPDMILLHYTGMPDVEGAIEKVYGEHASRILAALSTKPCAGTK